MEEPEVHPRPLSTQAEEGSQHAGPHERPPYKVAPPFDTMGTRHIEVALSDLAFPMTRKNLVETAGAWRIPVTGAHFRTLSEYLDDVEAESFDDVDEVVRAIERAWRDPRRHPQT